MFIFKFFFFLVQAEIEIEQNKEGLSKWSVLLLCYYVLYSVSKILDRF